MLDACTKDWEGKAGLIRLTELETTLRVVIHAKPLDGELTK
jgi:hypothetical protein